MNNPQNFTDATKSICRETCAAMGEPPCYKLPDMAQPCEQITPCAQCLAKAASAPKGE